MSMLCNLGQENTRAVGCRFGSYCLVALLALVSSGCLLKAEQTNDKPLPDEIKEAAQRFLDRIENPAPPAGKRSRRKIRHKRNEQGEIVSLQLRDIKLGEDELALVGKLIHLETLDLRSSNVTDQDLAILANLKNLRELSLEYTKIDGSGISALSKLENLRTISLRRTKVNDDTLHQLELPASLRELNLRDNQLTDKGLEQLGPNHSIEVLRLGGTKITDAGLMHLKNWEGLIGATLDGTLVTDEGLQDFGLQEKFLWIKNPDATADELVHRIEKGEHSAVSAMCSPGVTIPVRGKLKLAKLDKIEQSDSDRKKNVQRYRLEMEWTLEPGKVEELFVRFRVERGTVFLLEISIGD